jgi:hypothetical protein
MVVGNPIDPLHFVEKCAFMVDQVDVHRHESVRMRGATEAEMIRPHKRRDSIDHAFAQLVAVNRAFSFVVDSSCNAGRSPPPRTDGVTWYMPGLRRDIETKRSPEALAFMPLTIATLQARSPRSV